MGDHLVLQVDDLEKPKADVADGDSSSLSLSGSSNEPIIGEEREKETAETEPLIKNLVECRICQEEDLIKNLETPCACSGSLKYAHRACVQRWCNEKGDTTCEICHEPYKPNYTAPPRPPPDETIIDISGEWTINGTPLDLRDPRVIAMVAAQRNFLEEEYDEYSAANTSSAAFCRSIVLILMALLLLRHTLTLSDGDSDGDDDASTIFSLFLLRAAGFLLPCYIMAWAISILQRQRQRQEAATLSPAEVAQILESIQARAPEFNITLEGPHSPLATTPRATPIALS